MHFLQVLFRGSTYDKNKLVFLFLMGYVSIQYARTSVDTYGRNTQICQLQGRGDLKPP